MMKSDLVWSRGADLNKKNRDPKWKNGYYAHIHIRRRVETMSPFLLTLNNGRDRIRATRNA